jgi:hypothetical protein
MFGSYGKKLPKIILLAQGLHPGVNRLSNAMHWHHNRTNKTPRGTGSNLIRGWV